MDNYATFFDKVRESIQQDEFIKMSLGDYNGTELYLKNVYIKPVIIKREKKLSFVFRYKTQDITQNFEISTGIMEIQGLLKVEGFRVATLFTESQNLSCQLTKKGTWILRKEEPTAKKPVLLAHDKQKERKLDSAGKVYLQELGLTDAAGKVYKNAQDKWKQINHYIEILSAMLKRLPQKDTLNVVDMGAGKGYLTFALYDYLVHKLQKRTYLVGVEYRKDLVELCNQVAAKSDFKNLLFLRGAIEEYQPESDLDMLIALHACDTATDDAIAKGIRHHADLIVVAPCCHKQIRREMEKNKTPNGLDFLLKHGIFMERQAEMVTDGLRALIMEYYGYQTRVFEFVSDAHTPKNVLVVGERKSIDPKRQQEILAKICSIKTYFGIDYHHLETLLEVR
ncbi:methyltransferase family protein [Sphingobacterium allocomposti]|uniref:Methyltransferase family protein n=1 Tax=Sphingobacterium allocomposti TaxID=415956 RepID=A0A5S5DBS5_9SPHI|nr:SAM-dependent methyltransferase [Sphingobacterium composti Yoo et al. 2007 non Ten et al. 2007]TYP93155.1 methyltransferase family protein [Sphingobacterium composti Yoo et al. 2007 non Ten et al. 2007]